MCGKERVSKNAGKKQFGCPISESQAGIRKGKEIGATIKQTKKQTQNNMKVETTDHLFLGDSLGLVLEWEAGSAGWAGSARWLCGLWHSGFCKVTGEWFLEDPLSSGNTRVSVHQRAEQRRKKGPFWWGWGGGRIFAIQHSLVTKVRKRLLFSLWSFLQVSHQKGQTSQELANQG